MAAFSGKSLLIFSIIFSLFFVYFVSAQDYQLSGGEEDDVNLYLQAAVSGENNLKTKAEEFNGERSGVYDKEKLACPYAFERDLYVGIQGEDVRLLQVLLNSDRRTLVSVSGKESIGQESGNFGESTKDAVKRFQSLFIEYTGVANGRFGPRTRTVMNAICNGENKPSTAASAETRQNRNIYENVFSVQRGAVPGGIATIGVGQKVDITPPRVSLSANVSTVKFGESFKVLLNASEEIVPITPDSVIVDGGAVKEIRKLSKTSYSITLNHNEDAKKVLIQIEADRVEDLAGLKNENASNEVSVKVSGSAAVAKDGDTKTDDTKGVEEEINLDSILNKIISSSPECRYNGSGLLITVGTDGKQLNTTGCPQTQTQNQNLAGQTYNCNGQQIPVTQPCQNQQNQQQQTVCTQQPSLFGGAPQLVCQQMTPQQAQAAQQAQQQQDLNRLLGQLAHGRNQNATQPQQQQQTQPQPAFNPGSESARPMTAEERRRQAIADAADAKADANDICRRVGSESHPQCIAARREAKDFADRAKAMEGQEKNLSDAQKKVIDAEKKAIEVCGQNLDKSLKETSTHECRIARENLEKAEQRETEAKEKAEEARNQELEKRGQLYSAVPLEKIASDFPFFCKRKSIDDCDGDPKSTDKFYRGYKTKDKKSPYFIYTPKVERNLENTTGLLGGKAFKSIETLLTNEYFLCRDENGACSNPRNGENLYIYNGYDRKEEGFGFTEEKKE